MVLSAAGCGGGGGGGSGGGGGAAAGSSNGGGVCGPGFSGFGLRFIVLHSREQSLGNSHAGTLP